LRVAQEHKASEWMLEQGVGLDKPTALLVNDIGNAIDIATRVDERRLNYNPEIDWYAYEAVERGMSQLIQKDQLEEAKALALRLMKKGSYQMECSDEGLRMLQHDRIGCICERELTELAGGTSDN